MTEPDEFDQFYRDVRARVLLLTYGLTGDLPSSRAAVRDAFVVAWHHWRKVSCGDDPEAWVRELACRRAQRRHTAKLWHREKGLEPETKATLDALAKLSLQQRRVLLVTELSSASLADMAREVGITRTEAERDLQTATSQFSIHREVPTTSVRATLEAMGAHIEAARLPRATIIRRAGSTRRRTHTVIGVAATAAALVVTGTLVTDGDGVRPTLAGERVEAAPSNDDAGGSTQKAPVELPETTLLEATALSPALPGKDWAVGTTGDNTTGDGLAMTCQADRFAGHRPEAALVRSFDARPHDAGSATFVQMSEAARSTKAAEGAFDTALGWFAGCGSDRAQLLGTYRLPGVGDEATVVALHTWQRPEATVLAAVGRTGQYTTSVVSRTPGGDGPRPAALGRLLADSIGSLCALPEGGACADGPVKAVATRPVPVAEVPAMLDEVDLPPVVGVVKPWVGTEPRRALDNVAATGCDDTDFSGPDFSTNLTRTFLVPEAKLADEFGLTETVGVLPTRKKAQAFVNGVRDRLDRCSDKKIGTDVTRLRTRTSAGEDLTVWHVSTEVNTNRTVDFYMGILRTGTAVAQVGFVPDGTATLPQGAFEALAERALARLPEMPDPDVQP
ncbi:hypothetical protein [Nocardioides mangrovi]|uniref:RNA polymerase sigma factor 70 region 4 type 2 domain-containing protein n=1 Tax=Nocardioides mangrovi TaxID=2874580 RepID=A0ABS7UHS4_9ACTN|nr:hypothetical protein [Nocardioides mangrovi]MBZ5740188.1 hypothetical protein [Nocardioides mangrovi]